MTSLLYWIAGLLFGIVVGMVLLRRGTNECWDQLGEELAQLEDAVSVLRRGLPLYRRAKNGEPIYLLLRNQMLEDAEQVINDYEAGGE